MAQTFAQAITRRRQPYWWVQIEGLRYRYGTLKAGTDPIFDGWNPADSGNNQHIRPWLAGAPAIGGQTADPLNGSCSIPSHAFTLFDVDDSITALVSVSDSPFNKTYLTAPVDADDTTIPVMDTDGFAASGYFYLDRETIIYSGKGSDDDTDTCADYERTGLLADDGTIHTIIDAALTEDNIGSAGGGNETRHYWAGAIVTVTAGTNNGETRTVKESYYNIDDAVGVLILDSPMPDPNDATTEYSITPAPNRLKTTTLAGADDTWKGAVVTVTAGTNIGETRWVKSWDLSEDLLEVVTPFPTPCDSTSDFSIVLATFTGCTRGAFSSVAREHLLLDENLALVKRQVADKVPFLKTRRVWIYESRVGCAEAQALCTGGFITDHALSNNHTSYTFQCSGVLGKLAGKLLADPAVARLMRPLWGGTMQLRIDIAWEDKSPGVGFYVNKTSAYWCAFALSDGSFGGFTVDRLAVNSRYRFPVGGGHVKVDDEIINYEKAKLDEVGIGADVMNCLVLGAQYREIQLANIEAYWDVSQNMQKEEDFPRVACLDQRGLFAEKIGIADLRCNWVLSESTKGFLDHNGGELPAMPLDVNGLVTEHQADAEVKQVLVCYDSSRSEFARYDLIKYSGLAGGTFSVGDTITGGTSDNTAIVMNSASPYLTIAFMDDESSAFAVGETISCGGVSATVVTYTKELRPRNNAIDVFLQLVLSTGTVGANGMYDTLQKGLAMGLDASFVDITGIEALRDKYFAGSQINFVIHEPTEAKDFFEKSIFTPLQIFPYENTSGQIALGYLMTYQEADVMNSASALESLGGDELEAAPLPDWTSGQPPVGKLIIKYNKHPCTDDFLGEIDVIFENVREWYEDLGQNVEIELPTLYSADGRIRRVRHKDPRLPALLRRMLGVVWDRHAKHPCPVITCQADYSTITLNIGDPVLFSDSTLPNMRTSLRGLTDEYFQVIGKKANPETGKISFTLWQIGVHDSKYARRCPSAMVSSITPNSPAAGWTKVTCYASVFSESGYDLDSFNDGNVIMFLAADYDKLSTPIEEYTIVGSPASLYFYVHALITTPPVDGCFVEFAEYDSVQTSQKSARAYMADSKRVLGAGNVSAYKYL